MNSNLFLFIALSVVFVGQNIVNFLPESGIFSSLFTVNILLMSLIVFLWLIYVKNITQQQKKNFFFVIEFLFVWIWTLLFISYIVRIGLSWLDLSTIYPYIEWVLAYSQLLISYSVALGAILILSNTQNLKQIFFEEESRRSKISNNIFLSLFMFFILLVGGYLFSINISNLSFEDDEYYTVSVANNLHETWGLYQWDWIENIPGQYSERCEAKTYCHYTRAYVYTYLVEASYKVFWVSEFSTRFPWMVLYFVTLILLFTFLKLLKFRNTFISLVIAGFVGSKILFANFFIARMYGLLIFSSLFIYIAIVLINKFIRNKNISRIITVILILPLIVFIGYNSHISFILLMWVLWLFSCLLLKNEILSLIQKIKKLDIRLIIILSLIFLIVLSFFLQEFNIVSRFERFFTLRFDSGDYGRYFYYIMNSSFWQLGNPYYLIGIFFLWIVSFYKFSREEKNLFFTLPFFLVFVFTILHVYFLDTIFFIASRYVSHINLFWVIFTAMTIFILWSSFHTQMRRYFITLIFLISSFGIVNVLSDEVNKKNIFANYKLWYEKLLSELDIWEDILIGIPMRDYYMQWLGDTTRIFASQRFHDYDFQSFESDIEQYSDRDIYFIYTDNKVFHVDRKILNFLRANTKKFSHQGNVTIYKIPMTEKENIIDENTIDTEESTGE